MPKRRIFLIGIPVVAVVVMGLALLLRPAPEPDYEGKKLSEWVMQLVQTTTEARNPTADEAISKIGTNALPYLVEWVGYETPTWKKHASGVAYRILGARWEPDHMQALRRIGAINAFRQLGEKAKPEIEGLRRIASDAKRSESRRCAIFSLRAIGFAALPAIIAVTTNEQSRVPSSPEIRIMCATMISSFAIERPKTARVAEPTLLSMREDPDPNVRLAATNALHAIDPTWLEKLPKAGHD